MTIPCYASMNGHSVRVTLHEAWELIDGAWVQINPAVAGVNAAFMSAAVFTARFGPLPALPLGAFPD
jgi:hypothetical protein